MGRVVTNASADELTAQVLRRVVTNASMDELTAQVLRMVATNASMDELTAQVLRRVVTNAQVEAQLGGCQAPYMAAIEGLAPGCLQQCYSQGICGALSHAISAYGASRNKAAAKDAVCSHKGAFTCLLEGRHAAKCRPLISQASRFGVPTTASACR